MGINGKKKGNRAELAIAKEFSELFNDTFRRVPQSGALVGGANRFKNMTLRQDAQEILAGDVICPEWFPMSIESKCYGEKTGCNMYGILERNDPKLQEWIAQAKGDAEFAKKIYLLIIKITRKSDYCVIDYSKFVAILEQFSVEMPNKYIKYNDSIILDKQDFINNYIHFYFPEEKRNVKANQIIINTDTTST